MAIKRLSKKQKGFVKDFLATGNAVRSVLNNYDTKDYNTAAVIGNENLNKPNIQALIESYAEKAAQNIYELANNAEGEPVKLSANKDILDRAGFKPIEKSESKTTNINIDIKKQEELQVVAKQVIKTLRDGNNRSDK